MIAMVSKTFCLLKLHIMVFLIHICILIKLLEIKILFLEENTQICILFMSSHIYHNAANDESL